MNVMHQIAEARASALSLRASAKACTAEQAALRSRLVRAGESLDAMVLLATRALDRVELLLIQAQLLLNAADEANHGGHPVTYNLQRQAREVIGAALDRCAVGRVS